MLPLKLFLIVAYKLSPSIYSLIRLVYRIHCFSFRKLLTYSFGNFQGELKDQFRKEKIPMYLDILEKLVGESGKGGFAVGTSVSILVALWL